MKKNELRTAVVVAILLVVFTVISFAVPFHRNGIFALAYIFGMVAIAVQYLVMKISVIHPDSAKSKLYGFPIAKVGMMYMIIQVVLSLLTMVLANILPTWIVVVIYIVLIAAATIGFITTEAVREEVVRQEVKIQTDTGAMLALRSSLSMLPSKTEDSNLQKALQDLADECKYSDPVSNNMTQSIEAEMTAAVAVLKEYLLNNDTEKATSACKRVAGLLEERNRLCKAGKK